MAETLAVATPQEYEADVAAAAARRAQGQRTGPAITVAGAPEAAPGGWVDIPKQAAAPAPSNWVDVPSTPDTPKAPPAVGDSAGWADVQAVQPAQPAQAASGWVDLKVNKPDTIATDTAEALPGALQPFKDLPQDYIDTERKYRDMVTHGVGRVLGDPVPSEEGPLGEPTMKPPTMLQRGGGALEAVGGVLGYPFAGPEALLKSFVGRPLERVTDIPAEKTAELGSAATQLLAGSGAMRAGAKALVTGTLPPSEIADDIRRMVSPASRGREAAATAGMSRQYMAEAAQSEARSAEALKAFSYEVNQLSQAERYALIDEIESGKVAPAVGPPTAAQAASTLSPRLQQFARTLRTELDNRMDQIHNLGPGHDVDYIENYFPHLWKNPQGAAGAIKNHIAGRRSLEGSKDFTRARTHMTFDDGLKAGLVPVTDNPVEMTLLRLATMDRYITGQKILAEMKSQGLLRYVKPGNTIPPGWVPVEGIPKSQFGFQYYAPEQAATIVSNMLSPGFSGRAVYDTIRSTANMMNQAQLGMSMFHLGFVTMDSMISKVALGAKQFSRGEFKSGSANIAKGISPTAPVMNFLQGRKLLKQYLGTGSYGREMEEIVDGLIKAGGRVTMDKFYKGSAAGSFWAAVRQAAKGGASPTEKLLRGGEAIGQEVREGYRAHGAVGGTGQMLARVLDSTAAPMMEFLVPRMKLGVFFDLMQAELKRNPTMTLLEKRQIAQKLWDSVDNRMGQLVYDNLFWNKALKDLSMVSIRSVGWNLGTIREVGGGIADIGKSIKGVTKGEGITDRTAYVLAMPFITGLYGGMYQYLKTGEAPQEMADWFSPKTGGTDERGAEERMNLPTYMRDVLEYKHDPKGTVLNKINPLPSMIGQQLDNRDFFKAIILDKDGESSLARQEAEFLAKQFVPFGMRQQGLGDDSNLPWYERFFGARKAPAFISNPGRTQKYEHRDTQRARKIKQKMDARE